MFIFRNIIFRRHVSIEASLDVVVEKITWKLHSPRVVFSVMHGRSRMTIPVDPCIPTMSGRSTSGFRRPDRNCFHQARGALSCVLLLYVIPGIVLVR